MATSMSTASSQPQQQQLSTPQTPTSTYIRRGRLPRRDPDDDEQEGSIELSPFPSLPSRSAAETTTATEHTDVDDIRRVTSSATTTGSNLQRLNTVQSIWEEHVSTVVDAADCRDYLALERTFLGYLRTSVLLSLTGVTVAQLYAIQAKVAEDPSSGSSSSSSSVLPHPSQLEQREVRGSGGGGGSLDLIFNLSFSTIGKPLATACYVSAIWTVLAGSYRHWRYQRALKTRGTCFTGGIELASIWILFLGLVVTFLAFTIAID